MPCPLLYLSPGVNGLFCLWEQTLPDTVNEQRAEYSVWKPVHWDELKLGIEAQAHFVFSFPRSNLLLQMRRMVVGVVLVLETPEEERNILVSLGMYWRHLGENCISIHPVSGCAFILLLCSKCEVAFITAVPSLNMQYYVPFFLFFL